MSIKSIDLFSGAGGFSLGLEMAGIQTLSAVEVDRFAAETYGKNFPDVDPHQEDITTFSDKEIVSKFPEVDMVIGGPPCQGFSVAGPSQYGIIDKRNGLVFEFIRFVSLLKPNVCIMENVRGFLHGKLSKNDKVVPAVTAALDKLGYDTSIHTLFAADFGVPQSRTRVMIVGVKRGSGLPAPKIIPTHGKDSRKPWVNVDQALNDLPFIDSGEGVEFIKGTAAYRTRASNPYQRSMRKGSAGIYNHVSMKHKKIAGMI